MSMDVVRHFIANYQDYQDVRVKDFALIQSWVPWMTIGCTYLVLVTIVGPAFMARRKPIKHLTPVIFVYNLVQIYLNWRILRNVLPVMGTLSVRCNPVVSNYSYPNDVIITNLNYYFWMKVLDLLDTIFFVLRKKQSHITFLHLHHHFTMLPGVWISLVFGPGGHWMYMVFFNCIVHVIMYAYYTVALFPSMQPFLDRIKIYITRIQIMQLLMIWSTSMITLLNFNCPVNKLWMAGFTCNNTVMLCTFGYFYYHTYLKQKAKSAKNN